MPSHQRNLHAGFVLGAFGLFGAACAGPAAPPAAPPATTTAAAAPKPAAKVPGAMAGTRLHDGYVREIGRQAYFWAWPMVNVHNRYLTYDKLPGPGLAGGVLPVAPPNYL